MRTVQPGDVIGGKYIVERIIGRGGVGIIAAARHITIKQLVALKFLRPEVAGDPEVMQRFMREAQAAAQIRSEHVTRVMDAGMVEDGTLFLVFEYLEGRDLAAVLREDGPLSIADAVDYLTQACEAIAEAHAHGIVHRDLKPANLFLTRAPDGAPFVKVLDFGLSKFNRSATATALTADNHVIGSPHFMSPEQMRSSRDADARSDIWALGVVLFGLLTGRVPFEGEFLTEVCAAILGGKPLSLVELRPEAPPELEEVILRCLRNNPAERIQSVLELAEALRPFAPDGGQARAERIARVVGGAKRSFESSAGPEPASSASDAVTHGSSPVSWSISVGHARSMRAATDPASTAERDAQSVAAPPPLAPTLSASATSPDAIDRGPPAKRRSLLATVAAVSLLAGVTGTLWVGRDATRHAAASVAAARASATVPSATSSLTSVGLQATPAPSTELDSRVALRADTEPLQTRTAQPPLARVGSRSAPSSRAAVAPSTGEARRSPAVTPPVLPSAAPATSARRAADEELILGLPH